MQITWTPLVSFAAIAVIFGISDILSNKTKNYISGLVFATIISMALFWSGLMPTDVTSTSTLTSTLGAYGVAALLVSMGTSIDLEALLQEWKTILICCLGLVGLGIFAFTICVAVFGREYALIAAPPISGGVIAYQMVSEVANENGRADLAGFAALILAMQGLVGMPIASICLKIELNKMKKEGKLSKDYKTEVTKEFKLPSFAVFKTPKPENDTTTINFAKIAIVAVFAVLFSNLTGGALNVNIAYLLFGILFRRLNFLPKSALNKAGGYGLCLLAIYSITIDGVAAVTPQGLLDMLFPLLGMLLLGSGGIIAGSIIMGKILKYSIPLSIAVGVTALFGYPGTEILSKEVASSIEGATDEEKEKGLEYILPKMIVGGFTTVTIASVVFATVIVPTIF